MIVKGFLVAALRYLLFVKIIVVDKMILRAQNNLCETVNYVF